MSKFIVLADDGYPVNRAPIFNSHEEAEAWVASVEDWESPVTIWEQYDTIEERALAYQAIDDGDY